MPRPLLVVWLAAPVVIVALLWAWLVWGPARALRRQREQTPPQQTDEPSRVEEPAAPGD